MTDFWAILGAPLALLILGLIIEYWVIQPLRNSRVNEETIKRNRPDWHNATTQAIRNFRKRQPNYNGLLSRKSIKIETKEVRRGHAIIRIAVFESQSIWMKFINESDVEERFELTIDRTGDILRVKSLSIDSEKSDKSKNPLKRDPTPKDSLHPRPGAAYLYILIALLGGSGALASSATIYFLASQNYYPQDDPFFWVTALVTTTIGIVLAIGVDIYFEMERAYVWQRLPLSLLLGIIGAPIAALVSCTGLIILLPLAAVILDLIGSRQTTDT